MKGLLYKEFKLSLPTIIVYAAVQLVLTAIAIAMAFLSGGSEDDFTELSMILIMCSITMYFLFSLSPLTIFSCDATHAWQNFSASAPTGPAGQVGSKYLVLLTCYIVDLIIHTVQFIAVSRITDADFNYMIIIDIVLVSGSIILSSLELPFYFAFGFEKGQLVKAGAIGAVVFIGAVYLFFGNLSIFDTPDPLAVLLAYMTGSAVLFIPVAIVLIAVPLFCLSMMLSIKLFPMGLENLEQ